MDKNYGEASIRVAANCIMNEYRLMDGELPGPGEFPSDEGHRAFVHEQHIYSRREALIGALRAMKFAGLLKDYDLLKGEITVNPLEKNLPPRSRIGPVFVAMGKPSSGVPITQEDYTMNDKIVHTHTTSEPVEIITESPPCEHISARDVVETGVTEEVLKAEDRKYKRSPMNMIDEHPDAAKALEQLDILDFTAMEVRTMHYLMQEANAVELLPKVLRCLVDTVRHTTDLEGVYTHPQNMDPEVLEEFVPWDEVILVCDSVDAAAQKILELTGEKIIEMCQEALIDPDKEEPKTMSEGLDNIRQEYEHLVNEIYANIVYKIAIFHHEALTAGSEEYDAYNIARALVEKHGVDTFVEGTTEETLLDSVAITEYLREHVLFMTVPTIRDLYKRMRKVDQAETTGMIKDVLIRLNVLRRIIVETLVLLNDSDMHPVGNVTAMDIEEVDQLLKTRMHEISLGRSGAVDLDIMAKAQRIRKELKSFLDTRFVGMPTDMALIQAQA